MPTINPDLKPNENTYKGLMKRHGICRDFIDWQMPNMVEWWEVFTDNAESETDIKNSKKTKRGWQMAIINWMKIGFFGKSGNQWDKIKDRYCGNRKPTFSQGNIFQEIQADLIVSTENLQKPQLHQRTYRKPQKIESTILPEYKDMNQEQVLDQLRKEGFI